MTKSSLAQAINTFYEYLEMRPKTAKSCRAPHRRPPRQTPSLSPASEFTHYKVLVSSQPSQPSTQKNHNRYEYSTTNPNTLSITYKFSHLSIAASDPRRLETKQASTIQAPKPCRTTLISAVPSSEVPVARTSSEAGALNSVTRQRAICCVSFLFLS